LYLSSILSAVHVHPSHCSPSHHRIITSAAFNFQLHKFSRQDFLFLLDDPDLRTILVVLAIICRHDAVNMYPFHCSTSHHHLNSLQLRATRFTRLDFLFVVNGADSMRTILIVAYH